MFQSLVYCCVLELLGVPLHKIALPIVLNIASTASDRQVRDYRQPYKFNSEIERSQLISERQIIGWIARNLYLAVLGMI